MKCPVCADAVLVMTERQGVEIDYCPSCRGVWLDRGELDKLIEKSATQAPGTSPSASAPQPRALRPDFADSDYRHRSGQHGYQRKKSWLSDIFD
jgi:Zn-finger nucleic acid-binding protein